MLMTFCCTLFDSKNEKRDLEIQNHKTERELNDKNRQIREFKQNQIEYEKKKGDSMKGSKYFGTVFLPMPKVVDTNGAEWGKSELNILGLAAASLGEGLGKLGLDQESQAELENAKSIIGESYTGYSIPPKANKLF